jgi:hypothetical protein
VQAVLRRCGRVRDTFGEVGVQLLSAGSFAGGGEAGYGYQLESRE